MAFIRSREEECTGYQNSNILMDEYDTQCDFVMVYGVNDSTAQRIAQYKERGYVVHLMQGIAWGDYRDYLYGKYDGENHWDEAQTDRFGNYILHGKDMPYMVPTLSFAAYMAEKLKKAVDLGVEAIHVEEPEFWDRGGYAPAFQREYEMYYRTKWQPPHESVDARFKCSRLKQYLYTRTIDRVSSEVKSYSLKKYGKAVRFYVPTHSLLNYTQWKIVSPEAKLADIPCVDGCIAQVWTGTSREENWFNGIYRERTFETAYLEYGVMQELVKNTGRDMWFLHDPIEDNPVYDWNDYRRNYLCTVAASLLHPKINRFEICPWPYRIFFGSYPRDAADGTTIPEAYKTLLNNMFQTLGAFEGSDSEGFRAGILMGDAQLYQRDYPDHLFSMPPQEETGTVLVESEAFIKNLTDKVVTAQTPDPEWMLKYMASSSFPAFYGLALPLLKYGVELRPVLLDNVRRYPGYLDDYPVLIASYEYLKPDMPDMNAALAEWVKRGGTLIYIGDGSDPYHQIRSWWTGRWPTAAEHLFEMLGIRPGDEPKIYNCGRGKAAIWKKNPCFFSFSKENAEALRGFFKKAVPQTEYRNYLQIRRGPYLISAVMDESESDKPLHISGTYADMFTEDFAVITEKDVRTGENSLLCDISRLSEPVCVIGTSVRILDLRHNDQNIIMHVSGASGFTANIRIKTPCEPVGAWVDGVPCKYGYNSASGTVLLTFESVVGKREIRMETKGTSC